MSVLAHVFEAAGMSTVVLASMKPFVEKVAPPRTLYCEFPLGRPLGRPGDAAFQHDVLARAFALLDSPGPGPVLETHPEVIEEATEPMFCVLPPRYDASLPAVVDEANGLRKAYDRSVARRGVTSVGRVLDADGIAEALGVLQEIADGAHWKEVAIPGKNTIATVHDIRTYYEEAALELVDGPPPGGRAAEAWFYEETEAGRTVMAARRALADTEDVPFPVWFYMAPGNR